MEVITNFFKLLRNPKLRFLIRTSAIFLHRCESMYYAMIRSKQRDENEPRIKNEYFAEPNTTLPGFGNLPYGFLYLRDLVKTAGTHYFLFRKNTKELFHVFFLAGS